MYTILIIIIISMPDTRHEFFCLRCTCLSWYARRQVHWHQPCILRAEKCQTHRIRQPPLYNEEIKDKWVDNRTALTNIDIGNGNIVYACNNIFYKYLQNHTKQTRNLHVVIVAWKYTITYKTLLIMILEMIIIIMH